MIKNLLYILIPTLITGIAFYVNPLAGLSILLILIAVLIYIKFPAILSLLGQRQYGLGNNTKALKILKRAHDMGRGGIHPSATYAYILLRCGNTKEANMVLNYVLLNTKLKPAERNYLRQNLSLVKYKQGDMAEAERLMDEVFREYKSSGVYGALGYYKILANAPDAMAFCLEAYDYNAEDKVIIDNLVQLYLVEGNYARALELSEKSIDLKNTGIEIYYHAGMASLGLGDKKDAQQYFYKALSCPRSFMTTITPEEIEAALELADIGELTDVNDANNE